MPMPQLSSEDIAEMRDRLVGAALDLYREQGLAAVTLRAIAARLGISHTLPYRYLAGKEALIDAMRIRCFEELTAAIFAADRAAADPQRRLVTMATVYLLHARRFPDDYRLMFDLGHVGPEVAPDLHATRTKLFDFAVGLVQASLDARGLPGDARTLTHLSWSGVHGLLSLDLGGQLVQGRTFDDLVEPLLRAILGIEFAAGPRLVH